MFIPAAKLLELRHAFPAAGWVRSVPVPHPTAATIIVNLLPVTPVRSIVTAVRPGCLRAYNSACRLCFPEAKPMQGGCGAEGACSLKQVDEPLKTGKIRDNG